MRMTQRLALPAAHLSNLTVVILGLGPRTQA